MAYKLLDSAQQRWRRVNAPHLVARVRVGAVLIDGRLQERERTAKKRPPRGTPPASVSQPLGNTLVVV